MSKDSKKHRETLKELSKQAEEIRAEKINTAENEETAKFWATRSTNYILINAIYKTIEENDFKTFEDWKAEGGTVKRGSKAFVIWGQLIEGKEYSFFPVRFLFSNKQVYFPKDIRTEQQPEAVPEPQGEELF